METLKKNYSNDLFKFINMIIYDNYLGINDYLLYLNKLPKIANKIE